MPGTLDVLHGSGGDLALATSYPLDAYEALAAVHDLDDDGHAEVILVTGTGVVVLSFTGTELTERERFEVAIDPVRSAHLQPQGVSVLDIKGDRRPFLFVDLGDEYQTYRPERQSHVFAPDAVRLFKQQFAVADFDHDGASDLVTIESSEGMRPRLRVETSNRDGTTLTPRPGAVMPYDGTTLLAGDVDGDGNQDAVVLHGYGRISVALGDGTGNLKAARTFLAELAGETDRSAESFLLDVDGDGAGDLITGTELPATREQPIPGPVTLRLTPHACL
ncbi:MAG TPA: VCBS repeat-containing protein [Polyangiales bacterium]|nr:VCBS repeat-containing protein [Polyangiales bacterium]